MKKLVMVRSLDEMETATITRILPAITARLIITNEITDNSMRGSFRSFSSSSSAGLQGG